uniref:Uncharacterized protein n=1 Tax=Tanacetum cinerariifolium TaxID=118510 RepID=A0A699HJJ0_TANCI|nr:hypothetical protein [Tanacetum cinerariifolium]
MHPCRGGLKPHAPYGGDDVMMVAAVMIRRGGVVCGDGTMMDMMLMTTVGVVSAISGVVAAAAAVGGGDGGDGEKEYPLTQEMLLRMLSGRLEVDHECEMAYEFIRLLSADEVTAASYEVTAAGYSFYCW